MSSGFAERSLRDQQGLISHYIDMLVQRLRENSKDKDGQERSVDMLAWYSFCTFDIIADLVFAESFNMLQNQKPHQWMATF